MGDRESMDAAPEIVCRQTWSRSRSAEVWFTGERSMILIGGAASFGRRRHQVLTIATPSTTDTSGLPERLATSTATSLVYSTDFTFLRPCSIGPFGNVCACSLRARRLQDSYGRRMDASASAAHQYRSKNSTRPPLPQQRRTRRTAFLTLTRSNISAT